jgi:hypothetical protein
VLHKPAASRQVMLLSTAVVADVSSHRGLVQDEVAVAIASNGAALVVTDHDCRLGRWLGALSALSKMDAGSSAAQWQTAEASSVYRQIHTRQHMGR